MKQSVVYQIAIIALSCLAAYMFGGKMAFLALLVLLFLLYSLLMNLKKRKILYAWVILPVLFYLFFHLSDGFSEKYIQNRRLWSLFSLYTLMMAAGYMAGYFLSKCKTGVVHSCILTVVTLVLHISFNLVSHPLSFMLTGVTYLLASYIAFRYISQSKYVPLFIVAPLLVLNLDSWLTGSIGALPLTLIPFCSTGVYYLAFFLWKKRIVQTALIVIYALFLAYGYYSGYDSYRQWVVVQQSKLPPATVPEYTFYTLEGQEVTPQSLKGKIVVFDFWTTSCGVCFREFPELDRLYQKYRHREDIAIYAVNLPFRRDTKEKILETIDKHVNYSFPVLLAAEDSDYRSQFKIQGVPHLMIIDGNGQVAFNGTTNFSKRVAYSTEKMIDRLLE
ncbi:MAG: TlpA family protein disulfide reductase [Bacteroidales bacterium]|jgi:thiol-disulfide isomerase/thioredoxin|nr:TlpA family protein disulfide reductase [Bacteroidales bacterium]